MSIVKKVFSAEFFFALYLVAGSFKAALNIPFVDETVLLFIITVIAALLRFLQGGMKIPKQHFLPLILFVFLLIACLIAFTYSPSSVYATEKLIRFGIIAAWCYIGVFFLFKNEESVKRFLLGLVSLSVIMAVAVFTSESQSSLGFTSVFGSNYVALARISAMGAIILLAYSLFSKTGKFAKTATFLLVVVLFVPLIQSGARLPVLLIAAVMLMIPISMIKITKRGVFISKKIIPLFLVMIFIAIGIVLFVKSGAADTFIFRMEVLLQEQGGGSSAEGRTTRFNTATDMALDSYLLGKGLGSFPIYYNGIDEEDYPHNLYLEILAELGVLSLGVFLLILFMAFRSGVLYYKKYGLNSINTSIYGLFIFWFLNSFVSGNLTDEKVFYALIGIMILLPYLGYATSKEVSSGHEKKQKRYRLTW